MGNLAKWSLRATEFPDCFNHQRTLKLMFISFTRLPFQVIACGVDRHTDVGYGGVFDMILGDFISDLLDMIFCVR